MPRPMPVEPRFSRRLSILNSIPSDFSSSLRRAISSLRMSSFVVPSSSSLTASSEKNSRSSIAAGSAAAVRGEADGGAPSARVWSQPSRSYPLATSMSNLRRCMHFQARLACDACASRIPLDHDVPLYLAPMAGVSESPFRRLCRQLRRGRRRHRVPLGRGDPPRERGDAAQAPLRRRTSGRSACRSSAPSRRRWARRRALVTDVFQPEFIDINFGCPVKKVVKRNGGSGCLQRPRPRAAGHPRRRRGHAPAGDGEDPQRLERGDARPGRHRAALPGRRRARAHAAPAHAHADVHRARALGGDRRRRRTRSTSRSSATATSRRRRTRCGCASRPAARAS